MSIARLMQMARAGVPAGDVWTDPDLANASYDSVSFSVTTQEIFPNGLHFKPDGSKMYVIGSSGDDVNEYALSTAWDISTASFVQTFSVSVQDGIPTDVTFSPDGTKMYVVGVANDRVYEYTLSTAWDVSSASFIQNFGVSAQDTGPQGIDFSPDGLKMFIVGSDTDAIYEYTLSTAWDISTSSYVQSFSVASQDTVPSGLFFNPDGTKVFVSGTTGDSVYEYDLGTGWDISTASFVRSFSVASQDGLPQDVFFKSDGSKMYICGSANDTIYQYST